MGTSFTFASSAKDQIISRGCPWVMQGASQLLQKKLRTIKVTLKVATAFSWFSPNKTIKMISKKITSNQKEQ